LDFTKASTLPNVNAYDEVYTHNPVGEYGHLHHIDCFDFVYTRRIKHFWIFSYNYKSNPEVEYRSEIKPSCPLVSIYAEEMDFLRTFNLMSEGFTKIEAHPFIYC